MKRIKYLLFCIGLVIFPILVKAASGTITVSGPAQVVVGNNITVTVTLKGSGIGSWEMSLNYDKNVLKLTSTTAEGGGTVMAASVASPINSKSYTFKFKTLKTGSTKISVGGYEAYAFADFSEISLTSSSKTVKIITQQELEASYSKDNNLKSLSVEGFELTPGFNKDTLEYNLTVPEGTKTVNIKAVANDSKSSISGDGEVSVSEGTNTISIVVRAENGSEKTYKLNISVIDQNPIEVNVDNESFTVIKLRDNYKCPELFTETEITINEMTIPACYNENLNYTLVGLKQNDGTVNNYIYNNNTYIKYLEVTGTSLKIVIEDYKKDIEGLKRVKATINGNEYNVFKVSDNSKSYVVYGTNIENGEKGFYVYDTINKTFSNYDTEYIDILKKLNETYIYVIIAFGISLFLSIICMIKLSKNKKKNKDNKKLEEIENKEIDKKEIKEEYEEENEEVITEEETILDDEKSIKKKKRKKNKNKEK